ncbi:glycosyl hydrolase family 28-related protein [Roseomonas sp. HF4]|uniref:glycosyl hydrolase family 28-related protein n=1 Tax=Roseomonas sp. HF4 TaxID=2562313 RepID=UPI0014851DAB|nr:glycosyl hydrolase family 28-related protein [Roseomonas sp. HF4]
MSDTKISALPAAAAAADADLLPVVQGSGGGAVTRRASLAQLRTRLLADRPVHVRDFGAVGDGVTNDAPAIQAAVDAMAASGGGVLQFGPRAYRIASPVVIGSVSVVLQGAGFREGPNVADGTWLTVDTTGFTPFTFTGTSARGSAVRDLAVRQAHAGAQVPGWTPTDYDFVFRVQDCLGSVDFENVFLCGVTRGIRIDNSGRFNLEHIRGQVYDTGIEIDRAFDIGRIHHVHFWTFVTSDEDVVAYQQANMDAIVLRKVDGVFIDNIFTLGARSVLRLASSASGVTTKAYVGSLYADFARHGIWVEGNGVTALVANATMQGEVFGSGGTSVANASGIRIDGNNARLQVGNLRIDASESNAIRVEGTGNRLDVFSFRAQGYNRLNNGSAAIHLANVASGTPNACHLGSPALLGNGNSGPLLNGSTNGFVALAGPAGRIDRPGVMVGGETTGLFAPSSTELAAVADGAEVMRATAAGNVSLGGPDATPGMRVVRVASTANALEARSAIAGQPVSLTASGTDSSVSLNVAAKGTSGVLRLQVRNGTGFEVTATGTPGNYVRATAAGPGGTPTLNAQGSDTNVGLTLSPKGTGAVAASAPFRLPTYTVAALPSAATYGQCLAYVSDGSSSRRLAISDGSAWRWADGTVVA